MEMTKSLEEAFAQAARLSEGEQDALAGLILEEIASERRWDRQFVGSGDALARLAAEALADYEAGCTELLDPGGL